MNPPTASSQVPGSGTFSFRDPGLPLEARVSDLISRFTLEEKVSQLLHDNPAIPRLGIPSYTWWNEGLHGVARFGRATVFPQAIGLAATFDEDLVVRVASAIGDEARGKYRAAQKIGYEGRYSGLTFWSPNINIFRDPRWGRGQETYGEDPFLTGRIGVCFVRGLQGNDPRILKAAACAKHFVVHSGPEGERHTFNAAPSRKDFFETYVPAFEALVREAQVEGVMCAYNRTYGEPCCGSPFLIQDLLRKRWGFQGYTVSDCWAIHDFYRGHQVSLNVIASAAKALTSGINLNCGDEYKHLADAVRLGLITEHDIDQNLAQLLRTRFRLGLFDPDDRDPFAALDERVVHCPEHVALAREAAQKSLVLLKNARGVLPLSPRIRSLFVIGPTAANVDVLLGNYYGVSDHLVTVLEGIAGKIGAGVNLQYRQGFLLDRAHPNTVDWAVAEAQTADACIVVMGLSPLVEGEEGEALSSPFKGDREDLRLPEHQVSYLRKLRENNSKPIIVVLTGGSPIACPEVHTLSDAILFAWYPGEQGGNAVADVLFGDANPSGRLPITFPASVDQLPPFDEYSMKNRTYRYMEGVPLYPFGFGLSYARFTYEALKLSASSVSRGEDLTAEVTVVNQGTLPGEDVVQLYLTHVGASTEMPRCALSGFSRVRLAPGQKSAVRFGITSAMMSIVEEDGNRTVRKGRIKVIIGGSSPSDRSITLGASPPAQAVFDVR